MERRVRGEAATSTPRFPLLPRGQPFLEAPSVVQMKLRRRFDHVVFVMAALVLNLECPGDLQAHLQSYRCSRCLRD